MNEKLGPKERFAPARIARHQHACLTAYSQITGIPITRCISDALQDFIDVSIPANLSPSKLNLYQAATKLLVCQNDKLLPSPEKN